jgi:hypothetical protein
MGQSICSPLASNERGKGHETGHDGREQLQFLLQPPEEAEAHLSIRCDEGGGPRTKLTVRVHEQRVCSVDPSAGGSLCFVHIAAQTPLPRLRIDGALEGKVGHGMGNLGLGAGFFVSSLSAASRRSRSSFSASAADSFSSRLRLQFSATDLSRTASVCYVRRHSILPSSCRLSTENSKVSVPDAMCSAKAAAWHKSLSKNQSHGRIANSRSTGYSRVSAAAQLRWPRPSRRRPRQFCRRRKTWTTVLRGPLRHGRHGHRTSRHQRRDNSQLLGPRSYTMVTSEMQTSRKKNSPAGSCPVWASNIATPPTR